MTLFHRMSRRGLIAYGHDIFMAGLSFIIAIYLRIGATDYYLATRTLIDGTAAMVAIGGVVFWVSGLYRGVWRYASMDDLMAITRAVTITILTFLAIMFIWSRMQDVPRSVPLINWFVLMALLGGPRFVYRFWKDRRIGLNRATNGDSIPVLLLGASDGADQFLRGLHRSGSDVYRVVGILSEQPTRVGRTIRGVNVIGTIGDLETVYESLRKDGNAPRRLILSKEEIKGAPVRDLLDRGAALGMTLARVPRPTDFQDAGDARPQVKPVAIEDLLGRPQMPLDRQAMRTLIEGRRVLVTGAGGSIGSELARQTAAFAPSQLVLLENNEFALYAIDLEVSETVPGHARRTVIADVRDRDRIAAVIAKYEPDIVFHAAALKHVPLVEENPAEGIRTNLGGTINVADACSRGGVSEMVLISTDKAVNPTSVMGATKRAAEMYCQALDLGAGGCRFVTVRFGNVLGSTGSVVPLFQSQLAAGGPLTVTHPDMSRFFMTIHEAVELVLEAAAVDRTTPDSDGRIFVLDMGEPVKIVDLARQMIRLSGKEPDVDVEITFTGIRPGEKLYEEVFHGGEATVETGHDGLLLAAPRVVALDELRAAFEPLLAAAAAGDDAESLRLLHDIIPEYRNDDEPALRASSS